jgi:uncharacterized protein
MAGGNDRIDDFPVVGDIRDFDRSSGILLERLIFNYRWVLIILCAVITLLLGFQATKLVLNASFEKMIPHGQPYVRNYLENKDQLSGLGNAIRIAVENTQGDIFDPQYLEVLRQINDELFLTPGVDRAWMRSLWTPGLRWAEITEVGYEGGPIISDYYDGSKKSLDKLRRNIANAGLVGSMVGNNYKSSIVYVPLLDIDARGNRLDYRRFCAQIEKLRHAKESANNGKIKVYIVGFAKIVGELLDGLVKVMTFFIFAALIAGLAIFLYTRCLRSTVLVITCSIIAIIWQLGLIATLGFELDPFSILVPFLIFAIGVSHGSQKMNGIMQDIGRGTHRLVAARYTFRRLFLAGLTALLADAVGFAVLMLIDIPVIRDLALTASIGVGVLIFTNLILLPILLSFTGVSLSAAKRSLREETEERKGGGLGIIWRYLDRFTGRRWATGALATAGVITAIGLVISANLKIGDLDVGAPELRSDSRYNRDNAYITTNYGLSSDQFAVIVKTPTEGIGHYQTLVEIDRLSWALRQIPLVQTTKSLAEAVRVVTAATYEGNPKWLTISRNQDVTNLSVQQAWNNDRDLYNGDCSITSVIAYLSDHKAETLDRVVKVADDFAKTHNRDDRRFLLAAGNAGIEAATNIIVRESNFLMLLYVYSAVIVLCFITFRSWRAVLVAIIPLMITSVLCEALMVILGIGVKVATLPVIALGVGIGVDYALYLLSVQLTHQRRGLPLKEASRRAMQFTGRVVALVGVTLASGVITWAWSPIKFQADMGILLTFMFFWNMLGALILIPSLSHFLLNTVRPHEVEVPAKNIEICESA